MAANLHFSPGSTKGLQFDEGINLVAHKQKAACFQAMPIPVRNAG
jgi:hypothetical protein